MASQALALTVTLALLLAVPCAFCWKMNPEDEDACVKEATANSSLSEEDRAKALEINEQAHHEMHKMFKEKGREAMKELKGRDMAGEKVDASEEIKDKAAAKNFLKSIKQCSDKKFAILSFNKCQKAKDVNNDRLTGEDVPKMMAAIYNAHKEKGPVSEEDLEKKFAEALGSEEKAKVAMEVQKALRECAMTYMSEKAAKQE